MDVTEVTQGAYRSVVGSNPAKDTACGDRCPVEMVTWTDAKNYCQRVGKRLPTEAEWEYAARAGSTTEWSWGRDPGEADAYAWNNGAWFDGNSHAKIHPVGELQPNAWGLYDMFGNVCEWTSDWYGERYSARSKRNPTGPKSGSRRVVRGGGWHCSPAQLRSADRSHVDPGWGDFFLGFRCVGP
jgi:formylglycine-generating enzyme required for sulfatase activity